MVLGFGLKYLLDYYILRNFTSTIPNQYVGVLTTRSRRGAQVRYCRDYRFSSSIAVFRSRETRRKNFVLVECHPKSRWAFRVRNGGWDQIISCDLSKMKGYVVLACIAAQEKPPSGT